MDFAPRDNVSVIDGFKLHAMISCVGLIGSPKPIPASVQAEGGSSSGESPSAHPHAGAVAHPINVDACMTMAGWNGQGSAR